MRYILQSCFLVILTFFSYGCAVKIDALVMMPAGASEVVDLRNVAVFDFTGNRGAEYSAAVESILSEAQVNGRKIYRLLDRKNLDKLLKEQQFQMTMADEDHIVEMGLLLGAQGIWTGTASEKYDEDYSSEIRSRCSSYDNKGNCIYFTDYFIRCVTKTVEQTFTPKLIDVETGGVAFSKTYSSRAGDYSCEDIFFVSVSRSQLEREVFEDITAQFRKDAAPYPARVRLELMKSKEGTNEESKKLLKNGIHFAKENRLEKACELWEKGVKISPSSLSLRYNSALCLEIAHKYEEALEEFLSIESSLDKPNKLIIKAIERNEENILNKRKLKNQLKYFSR